MIKSISSKEKMTTISQIPRVENLGDPSPSAFSKFVVEYNEEFSNLNNDAKRIQLKDSSTRSLEERPEYLSVKNENLKKYEKDLFGFVEKAKPLFILGESQQNFTFGISEEKMKEQLISESREKNELFFETNKSSSLTNESVERLVSVFKQWFDSRMDILLKLYRRNTFALVKLKTQEAEAVRDAVKAFVTKINEREQTENDILTSTYIFDALKDEWNTITKTFSNTNPSPTFETYETVFDLLAERLFKDAKDETISAETFREKLFLFEKETNTITNPLVRACDAREIKKIDHSSIWDTVKINNKTFKNDISQIVSGIINEDRIPEAALVLSSEETSQSPLPSIDDAREILENVFEKHSSVASRWVLAITAFSVCDRISDFVKDFENSHKTINERLLKTLATKFENGPINKYKTTVDGIIPNLKTLLVDNDSEADAGNKVLRTKIQDLTLEDGAVTKWNEKIKQFKTEMNTRNYSKAIMDAMILTRELPNIIEFNSKTFEDAEEDAKEARDAAKKELEAEIAEAEQEIEQLSSKVESNSSNFDAAIKKAETAIKEYEELELGKAPTLQQLKEKEKKGNLASDEIEKVKRVSQKYRKSINETISTAKETILKLKDGSTTLLNLDNKLKDLNNRLLNLDQKFAEITQKQQTIQEQKKQQINLLENTSLKEKQGDEREINEAQKALEESGKKLSDAVDALNVSRVKDIPLFKNTTPKNQKSTLLNWEQELENTNLALKDYKEKKNNLKKALDKSDSPNQELETNTKEIIRNTDKRIKDVTNLLSTEQNQIKGIKEQQQAATATTTPERTQKPVSNAIEYLGDLLDADKCSIQRNHIENLIEKLQINNTASLSDYYGLRIAQTISENPTAMDFQDCEKDLESDFLAFVFEHWQEGDAAAEILCNISEKYIKGTSQKANSFVRACVGVEDEEDSTDITIDEDDLDALLKECENIHK